MKDSIINVECMVCHKPFQKTRKVFLHTQKHRGGRHFCSKNCKWKHFRSVTMIKLKCTGCNKEFEMEKARYTQRQKQNVGHHYCSHSCYHKYKRKSPFGYFVDKGKSRDRWEYDLDIDFLSELWKKQNGKCVYTGIKMILPETKKGFCKCHSIEKASLDRIDTTKGYLKGNVEFVCQGINFAKHNYSKDDMINFIGKIKSSSE